MGSTARGIARPAPIAGGRGHSVQGEGEGGSNFSKWQARWHLGTVRHERYDTVCRSSGQIATSEQVAVVEHAVARYPGSQSCSVDGAVRRICEAVEMKRGHTREGFYIDKDGRRSSAEFHEELLAGADNTRSLKRTRARARRRYGFTEEELDESYGPESRMDRGEAKRMGYTTEELDELFGPETK